jgi:hypothetical protein
MYSSSPSSIGTTATTGVPCLVINASRPVRATSSTTPLMLRDSSQVLTIPIAGKYAL